MAVADVERVEKVEKPAKEPAKSDGSGGGFGSDVVGWLPRKLRELRAFFVEVRAELKKVTWPGRQEVISTTVVVMVTTVFFGFYLWGLDIVFSRVLEVALKR
jgi:preprotein translocase subunit SecE